MSDYFLTISLTFQKKCRILTFCDKNLWILKFWDKSDDFLSLRPLIYWPGPCLVSCLLSEGPWLIYLQCRATILYLCLFNMWVAMLKSPKCSCLGKGAQIKIRKKSGLLPNSPRTPPVWHFFNKKMGVNFFFEKMPNWGGGGARGGFGKRPDFFRFFFCAPFPYK